MEALRKRTAYHEAGHADGDDPTVRTAYADYIQARTREMVDFNRPAIERAAAALLERGTLTRQELLLVIFPNFRPMTVQS
jgi:hypothetical protein